MTSNDPPDVDPVAVASSGHQGLQVLVFWVLARRSRVVHADTGGFSGLTASISSVAATVALSVRIVPATAAARARISGVRALLSAADRDPVVGAGPSCAAPMPRPATRPAQYGWSPHWATTTCGAPAREAVVVHQLRRERAFGRPVGVERRAEQRVKALGVQVIQHPVVGHLRRVWPTRQRRRRVVRRRQDDRAVGHVRRRRRPRLVHQRAHRRTDRHQRHADLGQLLRAVRRRAHPHLGAEFPQPHRESRQRFDTPARVIRRRQHTHSASPISVGSGLGQRLCGTTRVLRQAPGCAIR